MIKMKRLMAIALLFVCASIIVGCNVGGMNPNAQFDVPTPPPVTAIEPPEGIRATLSRDPRVMRAQDEAQSLADASAEKYSPTVLNDASGKLRFCNSGFGYAHEAYSEASGEFKGGVGFAICGWRNQRATVTVRIKDVDGSILYQEVVTTQDSPYDRPSNMASIYHQIKVTEQETTVVVEYEGEDGLFSAEHTISLPTEPRLYTYESGDAWLYGFEAGEEVQLLRYDVSERGYVEWETGGGITETYTLVDTQTLTVEADGTVAAYEIVAAGYGPYGARSIVLAVGEQTGELSGGQMGFVVENSVFEE